MGFLQFPQRWQVDSWMALTMILGYGTCLIIFVSIIKKNAKKLYLRFWFWFWLSPLWTLSIINTNPHKKMKKKKKKPKSQYHSWNVLHVTARGLDSSHVTKPTKLMRRLLSVIVKVDEMGPMIVIVTVAVIIIKVSNFSLKLEKMLVSNLKVSSKTPNRQMR